MKQNNSEYICTPVQTDKYLTALESALTDRARIYASQMEMLDGLIAAEKEKPIFKRSHRLLLFIFHEKRRAAASVSELQYIRNVLANLPRPNEEKNKDTSN